MDQKRGSYSLPFFGSYFFYYAGYCIFSSYIVLYLTEHGYSATICGGITSLTLLANLLMEPVGGYITDSILPAKQFLLICIGIICLLCGICTAFPHVPWILIPLMILTAGIAYPFSQIMDAWVNCAKELDSNIVYSNIRAGGSIGFAIIAIAAGYFFDYFGWGGYFLAQALMFVLMIPFFLFLPTIRLTNTREQQEDRQLSFRDSFLVLSRKKEYMCMLMMCTFYWFSHRPVGSFLSIIVQARNGSSSTYGNICGVGAVVEFLGLLLLAVWQKKGRLSLKTRMCLAILTGILRPLLIFVTSGVWALYLGQILQSISFAFYLSGSVECFARVADKRIRSFSISMGIMLSSAIGTVAANLVGGLLCDLLDTHALVFFSLAISVTNLLLFTMIYRNYIKSEK